MNVANLPTFGISVGGTRIFAPSFAAFSATVPGPLVTSKASLSYVRSRGNLVVEIGQQNHEQQNHELEGGAPARRRNERKTLRNEKSSSSE